MIKRISFFLLGTLLPLAIQAQNHFITDVGVRALLSEKDNTFWTHSNTNGLIAPNTSFLGTVNTEFSKYSGEYGRLVIGASGFYAVNRDESNALELNEYYGMYELHQFKVTLGAKQRPEKLMGLSGVGGDILWSNNARAIPGIEFATFEPFKIFDFLSIEGALGHYFLNDDRHMDKARLHYKQLTFNFKTYERSFLSLGLHHYAQWGGESQPNSVGDYIKVALGDTGSTKANQLGSYHIDYNYEFRNRDKLHVYYQSIFDVNAGIKLDNFPDGVWGAFWSTPEDTFIKGFLYEYQHTINSQNYFNHDTYQSGYTYFGEVIGTPFITPNRNPNADPDSPAIINNTYRAHHVGVTGRIFNLDYRGKASYVVNKGLPDNSYDPSHNNLYVYGELIYTPSERSSFLFSLGGDLRDSERNRLTASLGYRYRFGRLSRYIYRRN
ncbi:capsule assembly Wzi family protein [Arenibacter latericius]|uniref:capsule assembly Wzi family protein n=1 Tax=Arenibacter latericius TaxID=86104 RepID=UPI0003F59DAE|nr:capsule assembly Wzi family protein [Arenibacter latericius]